MQDDAIEVSDPVLLVKSPVVTVTMITYNHGPYLAEAIESVVNQVCDFEFELIIGEDASTDNTREIALAYQRRFPDRIRVVYSAGNVGMGANGYRISQRARGDFIATCEGDDFWCSTEKLAKQVAVFRLDPRVGAVHTDYVKLRQVDGVWQKSFTSSVHQRIPLKLLEGDLYETFHFPKILRTCTLMVRRGILHEMNHCGYLKRDYRFGDAVLAAFITQQWRIGYIPQVMAAYRLNPTSVMRAGAKSRVAFYQSTLEFDADAREYFAERRPFPDRYRWECAVSLVIWALRAKDAEGVKQGLSVLRRNYGPVQFVRQAANAVALRWPMRQKHFRKMPET